MTSTSNISFLLIIYFAFASSVSFSQCSEEKVFEITSLEAVPWPPISGLTSTFVFNGYTHKELNHLFLNTELSMKVGTSWISVPVSANNLCDEEMECPISTGKNSIRVPFEIPPITPIGTKWKGQFKFQTKEGDILCCIELDPVTVN